jgi:hydrogenase maturation protein HypF
VARVVAGRDMLLRRARGYAPLPIDLPSASPDLLAVGGQMKNCIAVVKDRSVFISQHLGDLETAPSLEAFRNEVDRFRLLFRVDPVRVVSDLHPDYLSTQEARRFGAPVAGVQHHYAHVASCMAEHGLEGPLLGVSWDGTGYGPDGTVWGGEFLVTIPGGFERRAALRPFRLPGGDRAVREPRRAALGVLHALLGDAAFARHDLPPLAACSEAERTVFRGMLEHEINAPLTTSAGRLFDAVAALLGLYPRSSFEGQAAMALEFLAEESLSEEAYPLEIGGTPLEVDWRPLIAGILDDLGRGTDRRRIARRFHQTMVAAIAGVAHRAGLPGSS